MCEERKYSLEELLKVVNLACEVQKARDYQEAATILIGQEDYLATKNDILCLDFLADCENNSHKEITLEDIHDCIDETGMWDPNYNLEDDAE